MPQLFRSRLQPRNLLMTLPLVVASALACGGGSDGPMNPGTGGTTQATGGAGGKAPATGGTVGTGGGSTGGGSTGGTTASTGGATGVTGGKGGTSTSTGGATGGTPGGGGATATRDHCAVGYDPQPTDEMMKDGPAEYWPAGKAQDAATVDLTVQPEVISWMQAHWWQNAHIEWHAIRSCTLPGGERGSKVGICKFTDLLTIPKNQNCNSTGDGYEFMLFHRHMMESLRQLWPKHTEQFTGFPKFPQSAMDVPAQWRAAWKTFNATDLANAKIADEIDKPENLKMFPDEGALGFWFQCNMGAMVSGFNLKSSGLHGDLHGHWIRSGNTDHGVGNTNANIDNYMFWKLHGWMDNVWEKYRIAKGQKRTDAKYVADYLSQCHEMDIEAEISRKMLKPGQGTNDPLPVESGFFHEKVRPIFDKNTCSGCHAEVGPEAGMSLGGHISSKDIVANLVNKQTLGGGQFKRVVPGKPEESWLYLKIMSMTSSCKATSTSQCFVGPMPPSSDGKATVTPEEAAIVKQWIMDGAKGPS